MNDQQSSPWRSRIIKAGIYLSVIIASLIIGLQILQAVVTNFTFTTASEYKCEGGSCPSTNVTVADGVAKLVEVAALDTDTLCTGDFDEAGNAFTSAECLSNNLIISAVSGGTAMTGRSPEPATTTQSGITNLWHLDENAAGSTTDAITSIAATESNVSVITGGGASSNFDDSRDFTPGTVTATSRASFETVGGADTNANRDHSSFDFSGSSPFTIAAWIRPDASTAQRTIVAKWQSRDNATNVSYLQYRFYLAATTDVLTFQTGNGSAAVSTITGSTAINESGTWSFVVFTFDGTNGRIYLNGKLDGGPTATTGPTNTAGTFAIGTEYTGTGPSGNDPYCTNGFDGRIDEAMTFNKALTSDEILDLYGATKRTVGLWPLNANSTDSSGFSHNGTDTTITYDATDMKIGTGAADFGGSSNIVIASSSFFDVTNELTLEAWIKPSSVTGTQYLITSNDAITPQYALRLNGNKIEAYSNDTTPNTLTGTKTINTTSWQHVAAIWNKGTLELYVNGALDDAVSYTGTITSGTVGIRLGQRSDATLGYSGSMDEAAIHLRAKHPEEFNRQGAGVSRFGSYESGTGVGAIDAASSKPWDKLEWSLPYGNFDDTEANLIHLYHFDDGTANDGKGTNNGTITNTLMVNSFLGKARYFDTTSNGKITTGSLTSYSSFTIEAWARFDSADASANQYIFAVGTDDPSLRRNISEQMEVLEAGTIRITSTNAIKDTFWHHYAVNYDGTNIKLYIDGVQDSSVGLASASSAAGALNIGDDGSGTEGFKGAVDHVAVFNPHVESSISNHYKYGALRVKFLARSSSTNTLTDIDWKGTDNTSNYKAPDTTTPAGKIALWFFDEASWTGTTNQVLDQTTNANHGTSKGGANTTKDALFGNAGFFNGQTDHVLVPDKANLRVGESTAADTLTIEAWVKMDSVQSDGATIVSKLCKTACGGTNVSSYALEVAATQKLRMRVSDDAGGDFTRTGSSDGTIPVGEWAHLVGVYSSGTITLYVNGSVTTGTNSGAAAGLDTLYDAGSLYIGKDGSDAARPGFRGKIDNLQIYNTAVSAADITTAYNKYNTANFLYNSTGDPGVANNQYFQYKIFLYSDGSESPSVDFIKIFNSKYTTAAVYVENANTNPLSFTDLISFAQTPATVPSGNYTSTDNVKYHLKLGTAGTYKYYDGANWVNTDGSYTQANLAGDLTVTALNAFETQIGTGDLYWRAVLRSNNGSNQVELDNIAIDATSGVDSVTVRRPVGVTTTVAATPFDIGWDATGTWHTGANQVNIEYSTGAGWTTIASNVDGDTATGGCTVQANEVGCYRVATGVPDAISSSFQVKVSEITDNVPTNTGGTNTVKGLITFNKPLAADVWKVETDKKIDGITDFVVEWTFTGSIGTLTLDFDETGAFAGAPARQITTGLIRNTNNGTACTAPANGGCYVVPAVASLPADTTLGALTAQFKLTASVTPTDAVESASFEVRGWYDLTAPISTSKWFVGEVDTRDITWTTHGDGLGNVDLEYSVNGGTWTAVNINQIADAAYTNQPDGDGSYTRTWSSVVDAGCATLNTTGGGGCDKVQIRVKQTGAGTINGTSPNFTIKPRISVVDPSPINLQIGDNRSVTWNYSGTVNGTVNLYYSKDNTWGACVSGAGKCGPLCSATAAGADDSCSFTVPNITFSKTVRFRAEAANDTADISSPSSATDAYIHTKFNVTAPTAASEKFPEENLTITWTETATPNTATRIEIHQRTGSGAWIRISDQGDGTGTADDGNFDGTGGGVAPDNDSGPWNITNTYIHNDVQVRVMDRAEFVNGAGSTYSAHIISFKSVLKPRLITPLGPVTWKVGETSRVIEWHYKGDHFTITPNVDIKYCDTGVITAAGCPSPTTIATVAVNNDPAGCTATPTSPESGGCYVWTDTPGDTDGVGNIRDKEVRIFVVDTGTTPTAVCSPNACSPDTRPVIDRSTNNGVNGVGSTSDIIIAPRVVFNSMAPRTSGGTKHPVTPYPTDATQLDADREYLIKWDSQGTGLNATPVDIHYSINNGGAYLAGNLIASPSNTSPATVPVSPNNTYTAWTTPSAKANITTTIPANQYKFRVRDPDTVNGFDAISFAESGTTYNLVAWFDNLTTPTYCKVQTSCSITWSSHPTDIGTVKIQYKKAAAWLNATGTITNDGGEAWTIPNEAGILRNDIQIRIVDMDTNDVQRTDPIPSATFNIVPNIAMTKPDTSGTPLGAGIHWRVGQTRVIHWKMVGDLAAVSNVAIEYDNTAPYNFADAKTIIASTAHGVDDTVDDVGVPGDERCTRNAPAAGEQTGCFGWLIPDNADFPEASTTVYIRVKDADPSPHADSTQVAGNGVSGAFAIDPIEAVTTVDVEIVGPETALIVDKDMDVKWIVTGDLLTLGRNVEIWWTNNGSSFSQIGGVYDADAATGGCSLVTGPNQPYTGCARVKPTDPLSSTYQIKVVDPNDAEIFKLSANKNLVGKVELQSLSSFYIVNSNIDVAWISFGSIDAAADSVIDFDTDHNSGAFSAPGNTQYTGLTQTSGAGTNNGTGCSPPATTAPQRGGCYRITTPDALTDNGGTPRYMRVRITDGTTNAKNAPSSDIEIRGQTDLINPIAGTIWKVETSTDINDTAISIGWKYHGSIGNITIDYDEDGDFTGALTNITGSAIAANNSTGCTPPSSSGYTGSGCYQWTAPVPARLSSGAAAKFRVNATTPNPDVISSIPSAPAFEMRGWYLVTEPTGTPWFTGDANLRTIAWETHGNVGNVDLQYGVGTSPTWTAVNAQGIGNYTNQADGDGSHSVNWTSVIDATGCTGNGQTIGCDKVKIRVIKNGGTITDDSNYFTIKPKLTFTDPIVADRDFQIGTSRTLAWTWNGTGSGTVNAYYSKDNTWGACISGNGKCVACSAPYDLSTPCTWNPIPDYPDTSVYLRVEAANDTTNVTDDGDQVIRIHAKFQTPAMACQASDNCTSEKQDVNTNITWAHVAGAGNSTSVPNVIVQYSTDGTNWNPANTLASQANDGIYNSSDGAGATQGPWKIPEGIVSDNVRIRVIDAIDATNADSAGVLGPFNVRALLSLATPDAANINWTIGTTQSIQWVMKGPPTMNVSLHLCQDGTIGCGAAAITTIAANNNAGGCTLPSAGTDETAGCYLWTISDNRDIDSRIVLKDAVATGTCTPDACASARPKLNDGSANDFKIMVNLSTTTTNPAPTGAGSNEIDANTLYDIKWNSEGAAAAVTAVTTQLSSDNGGGFSDIVLSEPNTSGTLGAPVLNTSDAQWTSPSLITDVPANRQYILRVKDPSASYPLAVSDKAVKVVAKFSFTNPISSTVAKVGELVTVSSSKNGSLVNSIYKYFTIDRGSYSAIVQDGSGGTSVTDANGERAYLSSFVWKVPDVAQIISNDARIQMIDGDDTHTLRTTPDATASFKIVANLVMLKPDGTETGASALKAGYNLNIQWKSIGTAGNGIPATVDLEYSSNNFGSENGAHASEPDGVSGCTVATAEGSCPLVADITNGSNVSTWGTCTLPSVGAGETGGCYTWKVHANAILNSLKIRVKDSDAGHPASTLVAGNGVSSAFDVTKSIKILNPNGGGGQQLTNGATYQVQWEIYGSFAVGTFDIEYGTDAELGNPIPSDPPANVILNLNPDYSTGCTLPSAPDQGGGRGCYGWTVPNDLRVNLKLRIYEDAASAKQDSSDSGFEIVGPLAMVTPNGGTSQYFRVGDTPVLIRWDNNSALPRESPIDLEYSTNGFSGVCVPATGAGACQVQDVSFNLAEGLDNSDTSPYRNISCGADGGADSICWQFSWKIPDTVSDTVTVRVIKQNTPTTGDASNDNFKIVGAITLNTLMGGTNQTYKIDNPANPGGNNVGISWTRTGTATAGGIFNGFKLDYCDNATCSANIYSIDADITLAEAGCNVDTSCDFTWTISTAHSAQMTSGENYYLRVMDPDQTLGARFSNDKFRLAGSIVLGQLTGDNEFYPIGTNKVLTWTRGGDQTAPFFDNFTVQVDNDADFSSPIMNTTVDFATAACNTDTSCALTWALSDQATWSTHMVTIPTYYMRVMDPNSSSDLTKTHASSGSNKIELYGVITLTSPLMNGGSLPEIFKIGTGATINWTRSGEEKLGVFDSFALQFDTDSGFALTPDPVTIATLTFAGANCSGADTSCTYAWSADATTYSSYITAIEDYYFRIIELDNSDRSVIAAQDKFELRGDIQLDALPQNPPASGSRIYKIGAGPTFTWTRVGNSQSPNFNNFQVDMCTTSNCQGGTITNLGNLANFTDAACNADTSCAFDWSSTFTAANFSNKISATEAYYLRVMDPTNTDTKVISSNAFKIAGRIALNALPNGTTSGDLIYFINEPVTLTWTRDGNQTLTNFDNFKVQYSTSSTFAANVRDIDVAGDTVFDFTEALCDADNACQITWTPNETLDANNDVVVPNKDYYLRVLDADDPDTASTSVGFANPQFELAGKLALTTLGQSGANESWTVGSAKVISWTRRGLQNGSTFATVNLHYDTTTLFNTPPTLINQAPNPTTVTINPTGTNCDVNGDCTYTWTVPITAPLSSGFAYYLRVIDTQNTDSKAVSTYRFRLRGNFTNLTPQAGAWPVGSNRTFSWDTTGVINNVYVSFSANGTFSDEKFFTDASGNLVYDPGKILSTPPDAIANTGNGNTSYTVVVPDSISAANTFKIRIYDASDTAVSVNSPTITVHGTTSAAALPGTQIYKIADPVTFTWTRTGSQTTTEFDNFVLQFSTSSTFAAGRNDIVTLDFSNTPGTGAFCTGADTSCTYTWTPDATTYTSKIILNKDYYLRVIEDTEKNLDNATALTESVAGQQFKIAGRIVMSVLPAGPISGQELYYAGENIVITWTRDGNDTNPGTFFDNFKVQYSTASNFASPIDIDVAGDSLFSFTEAACNADNSCQITWIPDETNDVVGSVKNYYLRVLDPEDLDTASTSVGFVNPQFELAGYLAWDGMFNTTETWKVGNVSDGRGKIITWDKKGLNNGSVFQNVDIQFDDNADFSSPLTPNPIATVPVNPSPTANCDASGNCSYTWNIGTTTALGNYYLRIIDPNNSDSKIRSNDKPVTTFKLIGDFANLNPQATPWPVGVDKTFSWDTIGNISNVKISCSPSGTFIGDEEFFTVSGGKLIASGFTTFAAAPSIAGTANGNRSYTMVVPDKIVNNTFEIRVYDANDSTVNKDTTGFTVHGATTLAALPGTQIYKIDNPATFTWTRSGSQTLTLFDNFAVQIDTDTAFNAGPDPLTLATLDFTNATGAKCEGADTSCEYTWTPDAVTYGSIITSSKVYYLRVLDTNQTATVSSSADFGSNKQFKVVANLVVSTPNGEQAPIWRVGQDRTISWTSSPATLPGANQVDIKYSTTGVGGPYNFVSTSGATTGDNFSNAAPKQFSWRIPDTVTNGAANVFIQVLDASDAEAKDESNAALSISGDVYFAAGDAPLGGENWAVYKANPSQLAVTQNIMWTTAGSGMTAVELRASNDGFNAVNVLLNMAGPYTTRSGSGPTYDWTFPWNISDSVAPTTPIGANWQIRVLNVTAGTPAVQNESATINIVSGFYLESANNATDACIINSTCAIEWETAGSVSDVLLEYSFDGTNWPDMHGTATLGSNPGNYNWPVADGLTPSATIRYRVTDAQAGHPQASDISGHPGTVLSRLVAKFPSANIKLNSNGQAIGGQTFLVGDTIKVDYTYSGIIGSIDVQYTVDTDNNPATFDSPVTLGVATGLSHPISPSGGVGQFQWLVQDLLELHPNTTRVQFRILDGGAVKDDSVNNTTNGVTGTFRVAGKINITDPILGTERWQVGSSIPISWTTTGQVTSVNMYYDVYDNLGNFIETVQMPGGPFVSNPDASTTRNVTVNVANFPNLDSRPLYYKRMYLRVADAAGEGGSPTHGAASMTVVKPIKVVGKLSLQEASSTPVSTDKWAVGSSKTITFSAFGKIARVNLYYDADDGLFDGDEVLITSSPIVLAAGEQGTDTAAGTAKSYSWNPFPVTLPLSAAYKIRAVDAGDASGNDNITPDALTYKLTSGTSLQDSDTFTVRGFVYTVVLTSGGSTTLHKAANAATVTWNSTGDNMTLSDIKFRDTTGGSPCYAGAWQPIATNHATVAGANSKNWTIPEDCNSTNIEVRVIPRIPNDGTETNAGYDFVTGRKFMPRITVIAPIANEELKIGPPVYDIKWEIKGVVSQIGIRYKTNCAAGPAVCDPATFTGASSYEITTVAINAGNKEGVNAKHSWNDAGTGGVADTPSVMSRLMIYVPTDDPIVDYDPGAGVDMGDVYGVSAGNTENFKIQGKFILQTPAADSELEVYHATLNPITTPLRWDWGGTIPNVILEFSNTYDGSDPATFAAGVKCVKDSSRTDCAAADMLIPNGAGSSGTNFTYNWQVPNNISRNSSPYYIRIRDPNDPAVFDIMPDGANNGFKIKSKVDLVTPDGGQDWLVGNLTYATSWTHTGTVPTVTLEYSGDGRWVHEDDNANGVLDGAEDTVASGGDEDGYLDVIGCVNGGTYPACNTLANANPTNATNSYNWQVPDNDRIVPWKCVNSTFYPDSDPNDLNHPCKVQTVKFRVRDGGDGNVINASAAAFTARYLSKKWYLQNAVTGANLDSISMYENSLHKVRAYSGQNLPGIVSPFTIWSPAGTSYTIAFSKVGFTDYFDAGQTSALADQVLVGTTFTTNPTTETQHAMIDERQTVFLSDIVAHNDRINTSFTYTAGTPDKIVFKVWYTRDGLNVITTTEAKLRLFDAGAIVPGFDLPQAVQDPVGSGVYTFTITTTGLVKTKNYDARNQVKLPTGTYLEGYDLINIGGQSESQTTDSNVTLITPIVTANLNAPIQSILDKIGNTGAGTLVDSLNQVKTDINNKIGNSTDTVDTTLMGKMNNQTQDIEDAIEEFNTDADQALFRMQDEITKSSIRLIVPDTTKVGSTETLRVATETGMSPTLDLLCPDGSKIIAGLSMTESVQEGIYTIQVTFGPNEFRCAVAKAVTVVANATIPSKDTADPALNVTAVDSVFLTSTDLDTIQGLASAGLNAEKAAKEAKDAISGVAKALAGDGLNVPAALAELQRSISRLPSQMNQDESGLNQMRNTLDEIAAKLQHFMGAEGVDLQGLLKNEIGEGMKGVRNKVDRTLVASEVMKDIIERKVGKRDEPVVETFYEIGSVKLRVVAVNPSEAKSQIVPIKIYLPKEVIPDDIIDMGELKVGYDSSKSLYYAFNDKVELAPLETKIFEVHLEDVWRIEDEEIKKIDTQTDRALKYLKDTEYYDKAKELVENIQLRMKEIETKQSDESVSREEHIGVYRTNLKVMENVKEDVQNLEKMLQHAGAPPSIDFLKDTVFEEKKDLDRITAWKLILGIIGVLGITGLGFYLHWFILIKRNRIVAKSGKSSQATVTETMDEREFASTAELGEEEPKTKDQSG